MEKKVDKMNMNRFSFEIVLPILYCLTLWSISFEVAPCFLITRSFHRCVWCGFESRSGHMWDKPSSACGCARWFFLWFSRFRPTYWLARLIWAEIILKGTLNWIRKKKQKHFHLNKFYCFFELYTCTVLFSGKKPAVWSWIHGHWGVLN